MKTLPSILSVIALCCTCIPSDCSGATFTVYDDRSNFNAAMMGAPLLTQDFELIATGTELRGIEFLPGVFVTSPFEHLEVWPGNSLFGYDGSTRLAGMAYYDVNCSGSYNAVSFNVAAWDPSAPGPANVEVSFSDDSSVLLQRFQTSGSEFLPVFFGIISDAFITRIRWRETPEVGGAGNEEVALDDFAVGTVLQRDSDGDGVPDARDLCPETPTHTVVDADGCSIDQLVPCGGPRTGGTWRNHGQYVAAVAKTAEAFLAAGLVTNAQKDAIVSAAARVDCGRNLFNR